MERLTFFESGRWWIKLNGGMYGGFPEVDRLAAYEDAMPIERAQELARAEKEGRLLVLPCEPDATAYQWKKGDDIPSMFRLSGVGIDEDGEITYQTHWGETFTPDDFGKTVFLTREEAEAALKKREEERIEFRDLSYDAERGKRLCGAEPPAPRESDGP